MSRPRTRLATVLFGALLTLGLVAPPTSAEPQPPYVVREGVTQPVFSAADAIRETAWVDTGISSHGNGVHDRVAVDIIRPSEPAQHGQRVPVIMDASPYYSCCGRGNENQRKTYDAQGKPLGFPLYYDNYFVPRGYAVVQVDLAGTNRSQGCVDIGGPSDVASARAAVDWLNGRAQGFESPSGGRPVPANWSTGNVGMIGKSYDGTIANGVAATGVPGLRTIVPISAISSWYDYYRSDGASFGDDPAELANTVEENKRPDCAPVTQRVTAGAPANGNRTPMWQQRDYVRDARSVRASVFAVHGLGDLNVKPVQFGQWWDALAGRDVPRKVWLSQTGHVDPFDYRRAEWVRTLHRWFDNQLLGINNGITAEPAASVERAPDHWVDEPTWAGGHAHRTDLHPSPGHTPGLGQLGTAPATPGARDGFTDDPAQDESAWAQHPDQPSPARTLFTTGPLRQDLRLAGTGSVTVTAVPSTPSAHLSAMVVDYGPATTRDYLGKGEGIRTLDTRSCWGESRPGDDACYRDTATTTANVDLEIVSRGWADLANYESPDHKSPLRPGQPYRMTFRMSTLDHVVPAGHRLGLIIAGTDRAMISPPDQPGRVDLRLDGTSLQLPVASGSLSDVAGATAPVEVHPQRPPEHPEARLNGDLVRQQTAGR